MSGTERPEQIRAFDDSCGESVCASDEKGACFSRIALDFPYLFGKRSAGQAFAPLVKDQAKTSFAPAEQLGAFARWIRRFDVGRLDSAEAPQAREVFGSSPHGRRPGEIYRLRRCTSARVKLILALNGVKIRRVIGASDQRSAGDKFETLAARNLAVEGKSFRVDVFDDRQVAVG